MATILSLISLFFLYLSKAQMTRDLSLFIHHLGGGHKAAIIVWSIIFLPGTIIHEVSHFLAAAFTGARTGKIEIFPEYLEDEVEEVDRQSVTLGYVQTQRLNPLQGFLVGTAPFVSGMALLIFFSSRFQQNYYSNNFRLLILEGYLFFTIANSFFPSWSDIKQTITLTILFTVGALVAWFFGFQLLLDTSSPVWKMLDYLWVAFSISVIINSVFIILLRTGNRLLRHQ